MIHSHSEPAPLSAADRALIGELRVLTTALDKHGLLANLAARGELLPGDILEQASEVRTAHLTAARDRCGAHLASFKRARLRGRLMSLMVPFAIGFAGTPYIVHLFS